MDAIGHQRNIDGATKRIFDRQARIQAELTTTVTTMVQKQIVIISQIEFTRLRHMGIHRMEDGEYDKAFEIWDKLVKREYRVMVFHEGLWRIGICLHETVGVEPRSYHVKIQDRTVLKDIPPELVLIRNDKIINLQQQIAELKGYLTIIS